MFWGLIVEPGKSYKQTVEKSFHVSMACLQPDKCKDPGYLSFILRTSGQEFVLCNLQKGNTNQVPLDLNFNAGDEIAFTTSGAKNTVHLSGYLITDEDEMDDEMLLGSDEEIDPADLKELNKKHKKLLEQAGSGKVPKLETADDEDDEDEDEDEEDSSDDQLEVIEEGDEDSDEEEDEDMEDEDEEEQIIVKQEIKPKGNKTPTTPTAQTNGNGPASGNKNKQNKDTPKNNANNATPNAQKTPKTPAGSPLRKTLEGGVIVEELKPGNGPAVRSGQIVKVYYTGRLKSNNKQFDATTSGKPFSFKLGRGEVIKGWDIGVCGMQLGGKRKITIPAALGYGAKGAPPSIPPNSMLVFEVEVKGIH